MTRNEADALKTYIDFMANSNDDHLFNPAIMSAILSDFNKSPRKPYASKKEPPTFFASTNDASDWVEEAGPIDRQQIDELIKRREDKDAADALAYHELMAEDQKWAPAFAAKRMAPVSYYEFKEMTKRKDKIDVYAVQSMRDEIVAFWRGIGYALTAEIPRPPEASILEFSFNGEDIEDEDHYANMPGEFASIEKLYDQFSDAGYPGANDMRDVMIQFAKLVRRLTVAETTDGIQARLVLRELDIHNIAASFSNNVGAAVHIVHTPDEDIIKLPKDFEI